MNSAPDGELDTDGAFFVAAFSAENRNDPYPLYRRMREMSPFMPTDIELHLAFGHEECWSVLRNPNASSDERRSATYRRILASDPASVSTFQLRRMLVFMDPPDHTTLRAIVSHGFTPRRVGQLRKFIEVTSAQLLSDLAEAVAPDSIDLIDAFAYPLPIAVICEMLGVPVADQHRFHSWSRAVTKSIDPGVLRSPEDDMLIEAAMGELQMYMRALLEERTAHPRDDMLSDILTAHSAMLTTSTPATTGDIDLDVIVDLVILLLIAGHETTVNLIGNGMAALFEHPNQMQLWRDNPSIAMTAIEELLRFDSPLQMVARVATTEIDVCGNRLAEGDQIIVLLGAANRDPRVFDEPDRLDLRRANAARHVSFGGGIHHCLGAALARTEGAIAITQLLQRFPKLAAAGEFPIRNTFTLRGREHLPVSLHG